MKISDIELNVKIEGIGDPFIWAHGLTSSMAAEDALDIFEWCELGKQLRLIRYDARGHGKSESSYQPEDYHWRNLANDMISLAKSLRINEYSVGGQSMGCATSIYTALINPEHVRRLVLVNPPTAWEKRNTQAGIYREMSKVGQLMGGRKLAELARKRIEGSPPAWLSGAPKNILENTNLGLKSMGGKTLFSLLQGAALTDLPPRDTLSEITVPVLILAWIGDPAHPLEVATDLYRLLPDSDLIVARNFADVKTWPDRIRAFLTQMS